MKKSIRLKETIVNINLSKQRIKTVLSFSEFNTDRKMINGLKRAEQQEQNEKNQSPVKKISITIEWKDSKMWGSNPHADVRIEHFNCTYSHEKYTCSGCGYDKESTVIADCFNDFLKYRLHELKKTRKKIPYGIHLPGGYSPYFDGGIGTNCYYEIAKFLGGTFKRIASGKTFDCYEFIMKKAPKK